MDNRGQAAMQIHHLEIVTKEVDAVCAAHAAASGVQFGGPLRAFALVLVLAAIAPRVLAQTASADSAAIVRLELELTDLLATGQFDRYAEHLTADYALTTPDGRLLTRPEALAQWRARGSGSRMAPRGMWVRMYGDAAILTAEVGSGSEGGQRSRITKLFVRQGQQWRLAALHGSRVGAS
jgi:ketosteroid isomerase-like protein